jgi:hypothetical protein
MKTYKRRKEGDEPERGARKKVDIEFLGLWDSVAALGFPQLPWLDSCLNLVRRHKFYDYAPSGTVKHVFHAVAIDDERRTFWPLIWDEENFKGTHIEQVWFSGVHSNVGGGYPRAGLANVTLEWMIERILGHTYSLDEDDRGLILEKDAVDAVQDGANPHGKLYDSRAGLALFYRFQPRPIEDLCSGDGKPHRGPAKIFIHDSVFDRMELRTAGYAPGHLPARFHEVYTKEPIDESSAVDDPTSSATLPRPQATLYSPRRGEQVNLDQPPPPRRTRKTNDNAENISPAITQMDSPRRQNRAGE